MDGDTVSPGITTTAIRVASTVTLDGPGASLFQEAAVGMRAVANRVNRAGGICGRRIELTTVNDSWIRAKSHALLRRFIEIEEDYFALVGMPASDGLVEAIQHGEIDEAAIPVVGTSGMADAEFTSRWVWRVGTSTATIMRRIAEDAREQGARRFALVRDGVHPGDAFAVACGQWCDGLTVFSPYAPATSDGDAALTAYVQSVRAERAGIDVRGLAAQHGYVAMTVFSDAARRCSPDLTRDCLRQVLDTATFDTGLTAPLRWHVGDRHANTAAHPSVIRVTAGAFTEREPAAIR